MIQQLRAAAFIAIALATGWVVYNFLYTGLPPTAWGVGLGPVRASGEATVRGVMRGSPADRAGIVAGDAIKVLAAPPLIANPVGRQHARFAIRHANGAVRTVTLTAPLLRTATDWLILVMQLLQLAMALLLTMKRWSNADARVLVLYFLCTAPTFARIAIVAQPWLTIATALQTFLAFASFAALIRFAAGYPWKSPASALRHSIAIYGTAVSLALAFLFASNIVHQWLPYDVFRAATRYGGVLFGDLIPVVALMLGAFSRLGSEADRTRLKLLLWFAIAGFIGPTIYSIILARSAVTFLNGPLYYPLLSTLIILTLGFAYVMLKHRMFDLAFVLNRAAIYAVITAVLVPLFAILEWGSERYILNQNRAASALIQVGIALVLFLSIRRLHAFADRFVDTVLFRDRHENEIAMRDFGRQVLFITDAQTIAERTVQTICARTAAAWSAMYLREDSGYAYRLAARCGEYLPPVAVSENDAAVVAMRTSHAAVAMRTSHAPVERLEGDAFDDALVLPLLARGQVTGFIACGPKTTNESYAPDERAALIQVAHGVAAALDGVRLTALEQELARYRAATAPI